jgi:hypothetical protein
VFRGRQVFSLDGDRVMSGSGSVSRERLPGSGVEDRGDQRRDGAQDGDRALGADSGSG